MHFGCRRHDIREFRLYVQTDAKLSGHIIAFWTPEFLRIIFTQSFPQIGGEMLWIGDCISDVSNSDNTY
jgi:hypothetical protein